MKAIVRKSTCAHPSCEGKWIVSYGGTARRAISHSLALALAYRMMGHVR